MSDKLETALAAICANHDRISEICSTEDDEYYFRWGQYAMSILRRTRPDPELGGAYSFFIYPKNSKTPIPDLAAACSLGGDLGGRDIAMKKFESSDYREDLFRRLYNLIENKHLGIDLILDEIAGSLPQPDITDSPF
jgi:hypothetical protein